VLHPTPVSAISVRFALESGVKGSLLYQDGGQTITATVRGKRTTYETPSPLHTPEQAMEAFLALSGLG